jgi:hypothetical protein
MNLFGDLIELVGGFLLGSLGVTLGIYVLMLAAQGLSAMRRQRRGGPEPARR